MAVKAALERIHRLLVMEIISPLETPETAMAAWDGRELRPESCANADSAVEIVDFADGTYSRTLP